MKAQTVRQLFERGSSKHRPCWKAYRAQHGGYVVMDTNDKSEIMRRFLSTGIRSKTKLVAEFKRLGVPVEII